MSRVRLPFTLADGGLLVAYDEEFRLLVNGLKLLLQESLKGSPVSIMGDPQDIDPARVTELLKRLLAEGEQSKNYIT